MTSKRVQRYDVSPLVLEQRNSTNRRTDAAESETYMDTSEQARQEMIERNRNAANNPSDARTDAAAQADIEREVAEQRRLARSREDLQDYLRAQRLEQLRSGK